MQRRHRVYPVMYRHLELNGEEFPFSRGLSFYELNEDGKIISARDIPEPTFKPGDAAFYVNAACMFYSCVPVLQDV